jgi:hypothetical protein
MGIYPVDEAGDEEGDFHQNILDRINKISRIGRQGILDMSYMKNMRGIKCEIHSLPSLMSFM